VRELTYLGEEEEGSFARIRGQPKGRNISISMDPSGDISCVLSAR